MAMTPVVTDATLQTSDITTNNVGTSKHGFAPKAPNDATKYLDGTGAYSVPAATAPALVKLSETVCGTATASVTFSSISAAYRNLRITVSGRSDANTAAQDLYLQFNGDTANSYNWNNLFNGGNNSNFAQTQAVGGSLSGNAAAVPAGAVGVVQITIFNYAGTTFFKAGVALNFRREATASAEYIINFGFDWGSTAAINAVKVFPAAGNFMTGSVITLYGET